MIRGSYGIAFDIKQIYLLEEVKRGLHKILFELFNNYYNKNWLNNRIYIELTNENVFFENEDLTKILFDSTVSELEKKINQVFNSETIFAFYLDDSTGERGFSLYETSINNKRIWIDTDLEKPIKVGKEIPEESFIHELTEVIEGEGNDQISIYTHKIDSKPIYGQRGIIEKVMRGILINRFHFDYEWQEYRGNTKLINSEDLPIQDLQLLYGN